MGKRHFPRFWIKEKEIPAAAKATDSIKTGGFHGRSVGVRFKEVGKVYYFDPKGIQMKKGDRAIVETARGIECGEVAMENREVDEATLSSR